MVAAVAANVVVMRHCNVSSLLKCTHIVVIVVVVFVVVVVVAIMKHHCIILPFFLHRFHSGWAQIWLILTKCS